MTLRCSWKLFSDKSKDCLSCDEYSSCRTTAEKHDFTRQYQKLFISTAVIEDDAKEAAEMIREEDRINLEMYGIEYPQAAQQQQPVEEDDPAELDDIRRTKSYRSLAPIVKFMESENVPILFTPPNDLFVSTFMMVTFSSPEFFTIRLTAQKDIPKAIKFVHKSFQGNKRVYKYAKKGTLNEIFPIIKSVVRNRKSNYEK